MINGKIKLNVVVFNFYIFMYVFSLSIPLFYHSAFFVGIAAIVHLACIGRVDFLLSKYAVSFLFVNVVGYCLILLIVLISGSLDISFFKTYTNCLLSSMCAIPLAKLIVHYKQKNASKFVAESFFNIFLMQSLIILAVFFIPDLKPVVSMFHRNPEVSSELDIFSNGLRTNALSGGLFFGLALSFGVGIIISAHYYLIVEKKIPSIKIIVAFILVNIGLVFTGRFGLVYTICLFIYFFFIPLKNKMKISAVFIFVCIFLLFFNILLYRMVPAFTNAYDNAIYPYVFEIIDSYISGKGFHTQSTSRLGDMYDINVSVDDLLYGTGYYTGDDGKYFMHTDVGFLRHLLYGGVLLVLFSLCHFFYLITPMLSMVKYKTEFRVLALSLFLFVSVSSLKGEVFLTMVSVITPIFLYSLTLNYENIRLKKDGWK